MLIRKTAGFFLAALLLAAPLAGLAAERSASAAAEPAPVTLSSENATLTLPGTYEQYLSLSSPTSVAMSDDYIAVADGNILYIYDRAENTYSAFLHYSFEHEESPENISKVQIAEVTGTDNDRIFFSDNGHLYEYATGKSSKEMIINNVSVQTFLVDDTNSSLYTAQSSAERNEISIHRYALTDEPMTVADSKATATLQMASSPNLTYADGILYVAYNDTNIAKFEAIHLERTGNEQVISGSGHISGLQSICVYCGSVYYTVKGSADGSDGLYRTETADRIPLGEEDANEGLSALTVHNGELYCIRDKSVLKLNIAEDGSASPTGYEIAAASNSVNRLSGATDSVRAGDLLVTADKGNNRISVYDLADKTFEVIPCEGVEHVATDGTTIAAATNEKIFIYEPVWKPESFSFVLQNTTTLKQNNVAGIVCMYDAFYFVTSDYHYGKITHDNDKWSISASTQRIGTTPKAITADLFGDIFVAADDGKVYELHEDDFATGTAPADPVAQIGSGYSSLRAGFDGALYYLDESGALCKDGTPIAKIEGQTFAYTGKETKPSSFALGFEDDEVYFCFGDFIVKSNAGELGLSMFGQLSDATDIVRAGDLLVTADTGNNRVTVYDMQKHSFTVIETDFSPALVATDGSVIAAASGNKVYVCKNPSENPNFDEPVTADLGTIKGLACVNGTAYYVTEYGYGKVEEEDKGLVSRLEGSPEALAADANGILYVVDTNGYVRYYYEDEFADPNIPSGGYTGLCLNTPISSLQADSAGNLYYLSENALWKNDKKLTEFGNNSLGYGGESSPVAFALDFESDDVYLLYGNYIVRTKPEALGILTLTDIYDIYLQTLPISDDKRQPPVGIKKSFGKNSRI